MISVKWSYFLYLLWLCYLIVSGILMFSRGFLLTRRTQNEISSCISYENATCEKIVHSNSELNSIKSKCTLHNKLRNLLQDVHNSSKYCLPRRSRVVFVIIDALMYEFTEYEENMTNPLYYHNNMPIFSELLDKSPNNTRMYKFIADPPTTTLQRLKGLTAGSLPTFIEAGENFASTEINEDNIIDQLIARGGKVVLLGDDTWDGLYPKRWLRSTAMHSFNTWDLDTVDNTINDRVYTEIAAKDWDLLIVHYIGVDHCGHKFGPNHPEMRRKLQEMNEAVGSIVKAIDDDTTLYVIGDHGMTATGNHGGDSDAEVTAALFVYSPNKLTRAPAPLNVTLVRQVDLVPTLSAVMGLPIPHSNLGSVIIDAIPYRDDLPYTDWQFALMNLWANVEQVTRYIQNYAESTDEFTTEIMDEIDKTYSILGQRVNDIYTERAFVSFATDAKQFLSDVRSMCQEVWIQFDSFSMSRGLLLVFLTIFFNYLIIDGIPVERIPNIFHSSFLWCAYCAMGLVALLSVVGYAYNVVDNVVLTILFSTGMISVCMLAMLVIQNWEYIAQQWYDYTKKKDIFDRAGRACLAMSAGGLFSNSYVVEEGSSTAFLFLTLLFMVAYSAKQPKYTGPLFLLVGVLMILSRNYRQCREQQGMCFFNQESSDVTPRMLIIGLLSLAVLVALTRLWLRSSGNLVSPTSLVWRYAPTVVAVCIGGHWVTSWGPYKTPQRSDNLARVAYGVILFLIGLVVAKPLSLYLVPRDSSSVSVMTDRNVIPQLYNHMKDLFVKRNDDRSRGERREGDTPVVCGLATVYSAAYVIVSLSVALLLAMLLSVNYAPSVGIMYATAALTLAIVAIARYQNATNAVQLMSVDACGTVLWMLLSLYHFYGSGHQPALNLIRWSAAFVGTGGQIHHNSLPATLVILNTYGSHILFGLTLPLLVLAPYTVYVMWGRVTRHDLARGEIALYERERHFLTCVFNVCVKYIVFFGFRMFMCMLAATIHCRHMMVWKIFTPKLIFEALGFGVTMISVLLSYLLLVRIHSALDRFLTKITKTY